MGIATATVSASNVPHQTATDDPQGEIIGPSATSLVGFFGTTPVARDSGPDQAAMPRGAACGFVATYGSQQSPTSIANITSGEKTLTLIGSGATIVPAITTNDIVYVNKPTSQAGLGVGNIRISTAGVPGTTAPVIGVTFSNFTAATITPTASQVYGVVVLKGFNPLTATLTPAAVAANSCIEQQFTCAGVRSGNATQKSVLQVSKPTSQAGLDIAGCRIVADNTIGITFVNVTAASITPTAAEVYNVFDLAGLDAINNEIMVSSTQSPVAVANAVAPEQGLTITGLAVSDTIKGVSKPTAQAGIGIVGWRVSAANTLGLTFVNPTAATVTPTVSEVYEIALFRPVPVAPCVCYTQALSPASVAPNTTAEQTFTVTGLPAGSAVWVNKPTAQPGLGIMGVRVSAANTLAINFTNCTAATITPTAAEVYSIANFQVPIGDTGSAWVQSASPTSQNASILLNAMRLAQVNMGLIAGA